MNGCMGKKMIIHEQGATIQSDQAHHHVKAGRFTCAVRPKQTDHLAAQDVKRDILDDRPSLIPFLQFFGAKLAHLLVLMDKRRPVIVSEFEPTRKVSVRHYRVGQNFPPWASVE